MNTNLNEKLFAIGLGTVLGLAFLLSWSPRLASQPSGSQSRPAVILIEAQCSNSREPAEPHSLRAEDPHEWDI